MLTRRQRDVLVFIEAYQRREGGVSPSCEEIAKGVGSKSKGRASQILRDLEFRGFIRRLKHRNRAIEVLKSPPPGIARIPIYDAQTHQIRGYVQ